MLRKVDVNGAVNFKQLQRRICTSSHVIIYFFEWKWILCIIIKRTR